MATCVQPAAANHARRASTASIVVANVRVSLVLALVLALAPSWPGRSKHATTVRLGMSKPQHAVCKRSIVVPLLPSARVRLSD
jgi:hypothetical protein